MSQPFTEEQKQQWKETIFKQQASGLSVAGWCQEQNIAPHTFYYWRSKLFPKPTLDRFAFTEVSTENESQALNHQGAGIRLEFEGVFIHLEREFDQSSLKQCLKVIKEAAC